MQVSHTSSYLQAVLKHRLTYARQQLLEPNLPLYFKAMSYVRICCDALLQYSSVLQNLSLEEGAYPPSLNLLRRLTGTHREWWLTCFINSEGELGSDDEYIDMLLDILNALVQSELALCHSLALS